MIIAIPKKIKYQYHIHSKIDFTQRMFKQVAIIELLIE